MNEGIRKFIFLAMMIENNFIDYFSICFVLIILKLKCSPCTSSKYNIQISVCRQLTCDTNSGDTSICILQFSTESMHMSDINKRMGIWPSTKVLLIYGYYFHASTHYDIITFHKYFLFIMAVLRSIYLYKRGQ